MTKFILLALLISGSAFAQGEMAPEVKPENALHHKVEETKRFDHRKSHWLTTFGFEGTGYHVPYKFDGDRTNFNPKTQEIYGGRLGFGGQIYLGAGFTTTTKVEGYYMGMLFSEVLNGGPDSSSVNFAYTKRVSQLYGIDAAQQLGYMFDMKTKNPFFDEWSHLTVEPFIEAGVGRAQAYNRLNYQYDTGPDATAARESYKDTINDTLMNVRLGGGINFTSNQGYFFYMRVTANKYDVVKREQSTYQDPNGAPPPVRSTNNVEPDPTTITVYALGGGYKF